ncbi:MAG TPA: MauE/DoxX family redox-associated membrane protein [Candidatus Limnocylindria bacterium]
MSGFALIGSALSALGSEWGSETGGVAACVIAVVLGVAAVAKIREPSLAARGISSFGIISGVHPRMALAVGIFEASLALGLIVESSRAFAIAVAALLLWLYTGLIGRQLARGNHEPCFCFGEADEGVSRRTLARTGGLALLATLALALGPPTTLHIVEQLLIALALTASAWLGSSMPGLLRLSRHEHGGPSRV